MYTSRGGREVDWLLKLNSTLQGARADIARLHLSSDLIDLLPPRVSLLDREDSSCHDRRESAFSAKNVMAKAHCPSLPFSPYI